MADDEEVVFTNSALYEHLKGTGFSDEDFKAEAPFKESIQSLNSQEEDPDIMRQSSPDKKKWHATVKDAISSALWDETWNEEITHLHQRRVDDLLVSLLESPVLEEEDATYIDSFATSMQSYRSDGGGDNFMGQVVTQIGVLGISLAYVAFRMFYLKSPELYSKYCIWGLDVLAIFLTILALLPNTLKSAGAGRVVCKLNGFSKSCGLFLGDVHGLCKLTKKSVRLIQEAELVARGFTLVNPHTPLARMEQGGGYATRQCPQLRKLAFHVPRTILLKVKAATVQLLKGFPSHVEIEGLSNYLANLPLDQYGPCITLQEESQLRSLTDNYCLAAVKSMGDLCNVHLSEFLRVLSMSCLTRAEEHQKNIGFKDERDVVEMLHEVLTQELKPFLRSYTLHRCLVLKEQEKERQGEDGGRRRRPFQQSPTSAVHIAIHSLSLHLQAALKRIQKLEESLDPILEQEEEAGDATPQDLPRSLKQRLTSDLKVIKIDLDACRDCYDESVVRLDREVPTNRAEEPGDDPDDSDQDSSTCPDSPDPVPLFDMSDPIIEDQVFEAYTDPTDPDVRDLDTDLSMTAEEKAKKRREREEAVRVLTELRSVIAIRAIDRERRERDALRRQNPDAEDTWDTAHAQSSMDPSQPPVEFCAPGTVRPAVEDLGRSPDGQPMTDADVKSRDLGGMELSGEGEGGDCVVGSSLGEIGGRAERTGGSAEDDDPSDHLASLKHKLASLGGGNFPFSANVAAMAVARSQQMAALSEDTFGGEGEVEVEEEEEGGSSGDVESDPEWDNSTG